MVDGDALGNAVGKTEGEGISTLDGDALGITLGEFEGTIVDT